MGRCGCGSSTCQCSIGSTSCVAVTGTGTTGDPYLVAPVISPDTNNQLACQANGLYARVVPESSAVVSTSQTTTSASYVDLATVGPSVTVTTGTIAVVELSAAFNSSSVNAQCFIAVAVSGATTRAASDTEALYLASFAASVFQRAGVSVTLTGLTAGSNIFTLRYRVSAGTGTFADRRISVRPGN